MPKTILYFYTTPSPFVKKDIEILEKRFTVKQYRFNVRSKLFLPFQLVKQKIFLLLNIFYADLLVCQFGGYHSFLPVLFAKFSGKKSLIITGGVDCVSYPSFNYGYLHKFPLGIFTKWSYQLANHIAPKHQSLIISEDSYYGKDSTTQGIKAFIAHFTTPFTVIHNGYDIAKWNCLGQKKNKSFITVCGGLDYSFQEQLKGVDLILGIVKFLPDCTFTFIGVTTDQKKSMVERYHLTSENIHFIPPQKNEDLVKYYCENEFYLQLSISEGFPNALCEAMLCKCIPIVSEVGAMPDIVGDSGFILKKRDTGMLKQLLVNAFNCDKNTVAEKARKRIVENYRIEFREEKLLRLVETIIG